MKPQDAARLLDIDPNSSPEQLEARFHELQRKLEDQIAKAPTPGLKAKYRASLADVTTAFETLVLAANSADLPMLRPEAAAATGGPAAPEARPSAPAPAAPRRKQGGRFELILVVVLALVLLAAGGWWMMKTREEAREKARIEAEARAAAEKEKARIAALATSLKTRLAEARIKWESFKREQQKAEQRLSELKGEARNTRDMSAGQIARTKAELEAQRSYVEWLDRFLDQHETKVIMAKAETLIASGAVDEAEASAKNLGELLEAGTREIEESSMLMLAITGGMAIKVVPEEATWTINDAFGGTFKGQGNGFVQDLGIGEATLRLKHPFFPDLTMKAEVHALDHPVEVEAVFPVGNLSLDSYPSGLAYSATDSHGNKFSGKTPARIEMVPGMAQVTLSRPGFKDETRRIEVPQGIRGASSLSSTVSVQSQRLNVSVAEEATEILLGGKLVGRGKALVKDIAPGTYSLVLKLGSLLPYKRSVEIKQEDSELKLSFNMTELSRKDQRCSRCEGSGSTHRRESCDSCNASGRLRCGNCDGKGSVVDAWGSAAEAFDAGMNNRQARTLYKRCPSCDGRGKVSCDSCRGHGYNDYTDTCSKCGGGGYLSRLQLSQ